MLNTQMTQIISLTVAEYNTTPLVCGKKLKTLEFITRVEV